MTLGDPIYLFPIKLKKAEPTGEKIDGIHWKASYRPASGKFGSILDQIQEVGKVRLEEDHVVAGLGQLVGDSTIGYHVGTGNRRGEDQDLVGGNIGQEEQGEEQKLKELSLQTIEYAW